MEIRTDWYVHIFPGVVILGSAFPILSSQAEVLHAILNSNLLASALILAILGYIAGFVANAIALQIVKPILEFLKLLSPPKSPDTAKFASVYLMGRTDLISAFEGSYRGMVLYRSLFGGFLLLTLSSLGGILFIRDHMLVRAITSVLFLIATFALYRHWLAYRTNHYDFLNAALI
jgi:hypothetical protein